MWESDSSSMEWYRKWSQEPSSILGWNIINSVINPMILSSIKSNFQENSLITAKPPDMPPHNLILENWTWARLLRILVTPCICNSTSFITKARKQHIIETTIISRISKVEHAISSKDSSHIMKPVIVFKRFNFPLHLYSAMTINK